ncbi:hypothetical protein AN477_07345 [Alicyclobacillus ferrooxydans]|uniref:Uncharacterized protein n=1 Tax=Alicyclobacillus ferrooxydans TaxID=471514 RepID=A0A0P9CNN6_9BACL|nr:hypothetical protein AN477_07345 [Alicyclobacillus ferrooxydans]
MRPYLGQRQIYDFNQQWKFIAQDEPGFKDVDVNDGEWETIHLPAPNRLLPHKDFPVETYQFCSWYRKHFTLPESAAGQRIVLMCDGAMAVAEVFVNGQHLGMHAGGYTSFSLDITDAVRVGKDNVIAIRLDSTRRTDVPPEGGIVDYMLFGGMYRNVYIAVHHPVYLEDVFLTTQAVTDEGARLRAQVEVANLTANPWTGTVSIRLNHRNGAAIDKAAFDLGSALGSDIPFDKSAALEKGAPIETSTPIETSAPFESTYEVDLTAGGVSTAEWEFFVPGANLWDVDDPQLYQVTARLVSDSGEVFDDAAFRFGVRTATPHADGLLLNGRVVKLRGLNRHQSFPYVGGAAPKRLQRRDAYVLKHELGLNYVRTSHYPQDQSFLDACDELGVLVFTELPGWQHIGDEAWQNQALDDLTSLITRDRNHPSIFMWGVRINESRDDHDFYIATNELAKSLDPMRPTGGVRNFRTSEFLEDVFTLNDFSMDLMPTVHTPQLITEYMGHMYPTAPFDPEPRLVEHALNHARIVNSLYGRDDLMGASGWCAFDYNTHSQFGPGDMVCYHGVMDMFRQPKFAAWFYASQQPAEERIVLNAASYFTFASAPHDVMLRELIDITAMEQELASAKYRMPVYVFSNCDEIEVHLNGHSLGRLLPDRDTFPNLPHPPFVFSVHGYQVCGGVDITGYKDGQQVAQTRLQTPQGGTRLKLRADDVELVADGSDMTQVIVELVDQNGTRSPYGNRAVTFICDGPGELVGENPVAMEGGRMGIFVRAGMVPGTIRVIASAFGVESAETVIRTTLDTSPRL